MTSAILRHPKAFQNVKRFSSVVLVVMLTAVCLSSSTHAADKERPNVIFILADDMGIGDVGCYGSILPTPNIDRIGEEGIKFSNHYSGSTVCGPSRSCLISGQHTGHAYQRGNPGQLAYSSKWRVDPTKLTRDEYIRLTDFPVLPPKPRDRISLAELFKNVGYNTATYGKWGLGNPDTSGGPGNVGFDESLVMATHKAAHSYHPDIIWKNGEILPNEGKKHVHPQYTDAALDFIKRNKSNPFFIYLAYQFPHSPYGKFDLLQAEEFVKKNGRLWPEKTRIYAAQVIQLDRSIGTIMKLLKDEGIDDNTIVIFCSDNGVSAVSTGFDNDNALTHLDSNGPYRGEKRDMYDGGVLTPCVIRWPTGIKAGSKTDFLSASWDFMPTFAEITGQTIPKQCSGVSMLPALLGKPAAPRPVDRPIYFEWGPLQAVRVGDWKLVKKVGKGGVPASELYHHPNDIGEANNVADQHPEKVQELLAVMEQQHIRSPDFPCRLVPEEVKANKMPEHLKRSRPTPEEIQQAAEKRKMNDEKKRKMKENRRKELEKLKAEEATKTE